MVGVRDVARIQTKLRLVIGTYVLQTNRSAFNQNHISPVCLLCRAEDETTEHFLLRCAALEIVRQPALAEILEIYGHHFGEPVHSDILVQLILDGAVVVVALLFYVHDKHLRSCRDGQLACPHFSWAGLDLLSG